MYQYQEHTYMYMYDVDSYLGVKPCSLSGPHPPGVFPAAARLRPHPWPTRLRRPEPAWNSARPAGLGTGPGMSGNLTSPPVCSSLTHTMGYELYNVHAQYIHIHLHVITI